MTNAASARAWLRRAPRATRPRSRKHFVAVSTNAEGGRRLRHRHRQHVRVLGLGRRPLLAVVGDRPADRARGRLRPLRGAARRRPRDGRALPHRAARAQPAGRSSACSASGTATSSAPRATPCCPTTSICTACRPTSSRRDMESNGKSVRRDGQRGRLRHRADHLGRARHQRPARLLPADPPGHRADPGGLPRRRARA